MGVQFWKILRESYEWTPVSSAYCGDSLASQVALPATTRTSTFRTVVWAKRLQVSLPSNICYVMTCNNNVYFGGDM